MTLVLVDFVAMKKCQSCIFFVKPFGQLSSLFFMNCLDLMYLIDLNLKPDSITNCVVKPKREAFRKKTGYFMTICQRAWKFTKDSL